MSGIEAAAAVAAIVSGFSAGVSLYRRWRSSGKKRRNPKRNAGHQKDNRGTKEQVELLLGRAGLLIQQEYNRKLTIIGQPFAVGDGKPSILLFPALIHIMIMDRCRAHATHVSSDHPSVISHSAFRKRDLRDFDAY
jgi:hypothetical protein